MYEGLLDEKGVLCKTPNMEEMRKDFYSVSVSDGKTRDAIKEVYDKYSLILEPHGAVGWAGLTSYLKESGWNGLSVCLETADPAKFPEEITRVLGIKPKTPESMLGLLEKKEYYEEAPSDYGSIKRFLTATPP
jgi:threonine synthase